MVNSDTSEGNRPLARSDVEHGAVASSERGLAVSWQNIHFQVIAENKEGTTEILKDVHGCAPSGKVLAIMGPSGAGKTSLLSVLAGKAVVGAADGSITFTTSDMRHTIPIDTLRSSRTIRDHISLVEQFDIFLPEVTMREHLQFHARLRLHTQSSSNRAAAIERVATLLHVKPRLDTRIMHLSGGEKKRLAIAEELLNDPPVLLLDEPTSGLDSFVAAEVCRVLASLQCTVILTIHQPSASIYNSFDNVLLLAQGEVCYQGPPHQLVEHFAACNVPCPTHMNPAEFGLEALAGDDVRIRLAKVCAENNLAAESDIAGEDAWLLPAKPKPSYWVEINTVLWRTFLERKRKRLATRLQVVSSTIVSLFAAAVYWRLDWSQEAVKSRIGALLFFMLHPIFSGVFESVMHLVMAHPMIVREFRVKHLVRLLPFYVARTSGEVLIQMLFPLLYVSIGFWAINFSSDFLRFLLFWGVLSVGVFHGISLGYFIGSLGTDMDLGITYAIIVIVPLFLFSGFLIEEATMIPWLANIKNISPFYWTYRGLMVTIWHGVEAIPKCKTEGGCSTNFDTGADVLKKNRIDPDHAMGELRFSVAISLALSICWRVCGYITLHIRHVWDGHILQKRNKRIKRKLSLQTSI